MLQAGTLLAVLSEVLSTQVRSYHLCVSFSQPMAPPEARRRCQAQVEKDVESDPQLRAFSAVVG